MSTDETGDATSSTPRDQPTHALCTGACTERQLLTQPTAHPANCSPNQLLSTEATLYNQLLTQPTAHPTNCSPNQLLSTEATLPRHAQFRRATLTT